MNKFIYIASETRLMRCKTDTIHKGATNSFKSTLIVSQGTEEENGAE